MSLATENNKRFAFGSDFSFFEMVLDETALQWSDDVVLRILQ